MVPFVIISFFIGVDIMPDLIIYFGLPKVLTFGVQIRKILPASCEATMPLEGPNGLPCYYKRLREWTWMYLQGQDGFDREELRLMWKPIWSFGTFGPLVSVVSVLVIKYKTRRTQAEDAGKAERGKGN
jgi:hypothetical protein